MKNELNGVAPLIDLGVIRAEGEDAAKFLHGQMTQDFSLLGLSEARLAAFCSAKGRMQASFYGFKRSHSEILLVCSKDILAPTLKRLSMFVMRAKVKLTDASNDYAVYGLAGDAIESIAGAPPSAWAKVDIGNANLISLYPADSVRRALWVAPVAEAAPAGVWATSAGALGRRGGRDNFIGFLQWPAGRPGRPSAWHVAHRAWRSSPAPRR